MLATLLRGSSSVILLFFTFSLSAQTVLDSPKLNRAVLRYFDTERMQALLADSNRAAKVMYYFTQSFQVAQIDCANCPIDYETFFNNDVFNVYQYESQRLPSAPVTLNYRDKYVITLAPADEVTAHIGGITVFELIRGIPFRPLPVWVSTGNDDVDFQQYKTSLLAWKNDFPQEYKELRKSPGLLKIRYIQFHEMTPEQRTAILSQSNAYLIVDDEVLSY